MSNDQAFIQAIEHYISLHRQHAELAKQIDAAGKHLDVTWRQQPTPDEVLRAREAYEQAEERVEELRQRIPAAKERLAWLSGGGLLNPDDKDIRREQKRIKQQLDDLPLEIGAAEAVRVLTHLRQLAAQYAYAKGWYQRLRAFVREQQDVPQVERYSVLGSIEYQLDHSRMRPIRAQARQLYGEGVDLENEVTWQQAALAKGEEAQRQAQADIAGNRRQRMRDEYKIMQSAYGAIG